MFGTNSKQRDFVKAAIYPLHIALCLPETAIYGGIGFSDNRAFDYIPAPAPFSPL